MDKEEMEKLSQDLVILKKDLQDIITRLHEALIS